MKKEELKIVFMGTPEFAVESLQRLVEGNYNVVAVVTQPDRPVGRHASVLQPSPVKQFAQSHNIPVLQPEKMKDSSFVEQLKTYQADLQVVVAFRMLPEIVWSMPRYGTFNVHAALLPQYRGAAPINWAVINGETQTGVTTFFLDKNIDTGRIIMQRAFGIPDDANVEFVYEGLMHLGAQLCIDTVDALIAGDGNIGSFPQQEPDDLKTAPKLFKENCQINWEQPSKRIYDFIRGLSPYPGAWCDFEGTILKIYQTEKTASPCNCNSGIFENREGKLLVSTEDFWLEIKELQLAGKKRLDAKSFLNGRKI